MNKKFVVSVKRHFIYDWFLALIFRFNAHNLTEIAAL